MDENGKLLWLEINTPHSIPAQEFYSTLFGWQVETLHSQAFGILPVFKNNDHEIGNVFMAMGAFVPSRWLTFLGGDPEKIASKVKTLGGQADANPSVIGGWATLLGIRDPEGTNTTIIKFFDNEKQTARGEPGEPYMVELYARDGEKLSSFYQELFGAERKSLKNRWLVKRDGEILHSITTNNYGDFIQRWVPYFRTNAIRADERRAVMAGAVVQIPISEIDGLGELSVLVDPVGGYFGLINPS